MIKGDLRKKQILETAEKLFTEKGYQTTSVQDILDELGLSKGSFYHHFESKELVLRTICEQRARATADRLQHSAGGDGVERLNALLRSMIPFTEEGLAFLSMLQPVFLLPEGKSVLTGYQEALKSMWLEPTRAALEQMILEGSGYSPYPEKTAEIILDLVNDLWAGLSREILKGKQQTTQSLAAALLSQVEPYRAAVENLMTAPYGSVTLVETTDLVKTAEALRQKQD